MPQLETTPFSNGHVALALENAGYDPSDAHQPGCYALSCHKPTSDLERLTRRWLRFSDHAPPYLPQCADASQIVYCGASGSIFDRLVDHAEGDKRVTTFLKVFEPREILRIWPDKEPFLRERQYADRLTRELDGAYVHCR